MTDAPRILNEVEDEDITRFRGAAAQYLAQLHPHRAMSVVGEMLMRTLHCFPASQQREIFEAWADSFGPPKDVEQ
jgi:hypothetical protein